MPAEETESFLLRILTPQGEILQGPVEALQAQGLLGAFEVLPGHEPLLASLAAGPLVVKQVEQENEETYRLTGGFMKIGRDKVLVLADSVERAEEAAPDDPA
ncbi:MAG: ATP synthase F1 subunit epsilon [Planctomycetota bacterium]